MHERIARRLTRDLVPVADIQADDAELDTAHLELARAILDGRPTAAARLSRTIAQRELRSLGATVGS